MLAVSGGWGIEVGHIKVVVKIPDTIYPELVADLERVQLRDRAERIRVLAMMGIRQTGLVSQNVSFPVAHIGNNYSSDHHDETTTSRLIKRLTDNL